MNAPLRHRVRARAKPPDPDPPDQVPIVIGMDHSFPGILREGTEKHEPYSIAIATYTPFQPKIQSYLWVASHPNECVNRVCSSTAFRRKSKATLKRLAFSMTLSIRHAAELEIIRRELIEHHFPARSNYQ